MYNEAKLRNLDYKSESTDIEQMSQDSSDKRRLEEEKEMENAQDPDTDIAND